MIIQHNLLAINNMNVGKQLNINMSKITEKLSSGYQINRASDNAANLAISEKMNAKIRALNRSQNNIEEGISLVQVAEGALQEVSNMLTRVHELCVQAANGTNTEDDRTKISEEIGQIYDEMNRIFESTEYNTMPIFKVGGTSAKDRYTYTENVVTLPVGQYSEFGEMTEVETKWFELATEAKGATVTMTLDSDIDLNDASTLDGKSFYMEFKYEKNGRIYDEKVKFLCDKNFTLGGIDTQDEIKTIYVPHIQSTYTAQEVFDILSQQSVSYYEPFKYIDFKDITVSELDGKKQVIFQLDPHNLQQSFEINGNQINYVAINTNGIIGNDFKIYSNEGKDLNEIDSSNNIIQYDTDIYGKWIIYSNDIISEEEKKALLDSYLDFNINNNINRVSFSDVEVNSLNTKVDLMNLLKNKLESMGCVVDIDGSYLKINKNNCVSETQEDSIVYVKETKKDGTEKNSNGIFMSIYESVSPTTEQAGEWIIEFPTGLNIDEPFSLTIAGQKYIFYDKSKGLVDASSATECSVDGDIGEAVKNVIGSKYKNATVTFNGNKIYIKANNVNEDLNISVKSESVKYHTYAISKSKASFSQEYNIKFDLTESSAGGILNVENLYGRGFEHNGKTYEFSNATNQLSNKEIIRIDISNCSNYSEIAVIIENELNNNSDEASRFSYKVTNTSGIININSGKIMDGALNYIYKPYFIDGVSGQDGLFNDGFGTVQGNFSGGTNATQAYTTIDFSDYSIENKDELYGRGFRIMCATCPGEFFNIMFCHDKETFEYPKSFMYTDEDGNTNEIKNYIVELKDISTGSQIVDNIVEQLENELDHYTEVKGQGSKLLVQDKRLGNIKDLNNVLQRAKILSGVFVNYKYDVEKKDNSDLKIEQLGDTDTYCSLVNIYASDCAENPYISVHLPNFTLDNLKLAPITSKFTTEEGVIEVMDQAKGAAEMVNMARSKLGADQNRLEHALNYTTNAEVQMTDAYSRIRDTDMAEMAVNQAKMSILSNVQQVMLSHIMSQPEKIVSLLQE